MKPTPGFHKISVRDAQFRADPTGGPGILRVFDPHALIQAAGYLKFACAQNEELVFFRGQSKHYQTLPPSLFRGGQSQNAHAIRLTRLKAALKKLALDNKALRDLPEIAREPLLQHYGFKTTWIDLVDNVWIALWFACHAARAIGEFDEYLHFERRHTPQIPDSEFAYIYLVATDKAPATIPGVWAGARTELVDLRICCPSTFLRPHAQHGVLFRMKGGQTRRPPEYSSQIRGVIEVEMSQALRWLGDGEMLGVHSLFPPPFYDQGYAWLLESKFEGDALVGSIAHVGA